MSGQRFALGAATVLTALLLQYAVVARLPLPGAAPDLVLVLVLAFALAEGPMSGMVTGFVAGLLADLTGDLEVGRLALAYTVAGYLVGTIQDDTERSTLVPFLAVAGGSAVAVLAFAAEGLLLGDPRVTGGSVLSALASTTAYDVALTPFVVPVVAVLVRRLEAGAATRR